MWTSENGFFFSPIIHPLTLGINISDTVETCSVYSVMSAFFVFPLWEVIHVGPGSSPTVWLTEPKDLWWKEKKGKKKALYEKYRHSSKCGVWGVAIFPVTNTRKTHFSSRSKMWWWEVQDRDWVFKTCLLFLLRLTLMDSTRIFCHHWRTSGLHNSRCNWWFTKPSLFPLVTVLLLWLYLWNCGSLPWDRIQKQPLVFSLFVVHHWLI